jgi:hypothetical protein
VLYLLPLGLDAKHSGVGQGVFPCFSTIHRRKAAKTTPLSSLPLLLFGFHRSHPKSTLRFGPSVFDFEVLTSAELARLLKVRESWVIDQSKRSRTSDPMPVFRLGKHRRYRWGSPEMNDWLDRRAGYNTTTRKAGSQENGGAI